MHPSLLTGDDPGLAQGPCVQVYLLVDTRALDRPLDYLVPPELDGAIGTGALVACPLGPRRVVGVVVGTEPATRCRTACRARRPRRDAGDPAAAAGSGDVGRAVLRRPCRLVPAPGRPARRGGGPAPGTDGSWRLATPPRGPAPRLVVRRVSGAPTGTTRQAQILAHVPNGDAVAAAELVRRAGTTMDTLRRMASAGLIAITSQTPAAEDVHGLGMPVPAAPGY